MHSFPAAFECRKGEPTGNLRDGAKTSFLLPHFSCRPSFALPADAFPGRVLRNERSESFLVGYPSLDELIAYPVALENLSEDLEPSIELTSQDAMRCVGDLKWPTLIGDSRS